MKTKQPKQKRCLYTKVAVEKAKEAVAQGMPINVASVKFGIPRTTLHAKIVNKYVEKKPGPQTILSKEEEEILVQWILHMSNRGYPVTKHQLINSVEMLIKQSQRKNPFTNNRPGRTWYNAFLHRHPELSERVTENVSLSRASVDEKYIQKWFEDVESYLKQKDLINIDASRVFNSDETSLLLNPKSNAVLVQKGTKNVYNIVDNNEKESLTLLVTGNAAGELTVPLILFPYQRIPVSIYNRMPEGFSYGKSDKGWMTAENFFEYIANVFYPWIIKNNILMPVILFVDGHSSHLTHTLSDFCSKHEIEIIALPPNTTHITQPMDVAVFAPLNAMWKKAVNNYRCEHNRLSVSKEDVGNLLQKSFQ